MNYIAYTENEDSSINILAGSSNPRVFSKILSNEKYKIHEGEVYQANNKTFLTKSKEYLYQKELEEKENNLRRLKIFYEENKEIIMKNYDEAVLINDTYMQNELKSKLTELIVNYDKELKNISKE